MFFRYLTVVPIYYNFIDSPRGGHHRYGYVNDGPLLLHFRVITSLLSSVIVELLIIQYCLFTRSQINV